MFVLRQIGPERGDCTAPYDVDFEGRTYTVTDFIRGLLEERSGDWGKIRIYIDPRFRSIEPSCEYKYGALLTQLPDEFLNREIYHAKASGGWSNMDYYLYLKENKPKRNTYTDIYEEFLKTIGNREELIADYKPCATPYFDITIPMGIIVWIKDGSKIIYISKGE